MSKPKFAIYPTLLDCYQTYLNSDDIWEQYWGFSENPSQTPEEFREQKFQDLIDTINRVEGEFSEAADRGTCFNEVVDCLILGRPTKRPDMAIQSDKEHGIVNATLHGHSFVFPLDLCMRWAKRYKGALPQYKCEAVLETPRGDVLLYGYIDELMPFGVHDIKTTGSYSVGKYRNNWQHRVYPYCITEQDGHCDYFQYDVLTIDRKGCFDEVSEYYAYRHATAKDELYLFCIDFIDFLHENENLIDKDKTHIFI